MVKIIFATILILFPLGQLTKINGVNLIDVAVGLLAVITILKRPKYPEWFKYFLYFILFCVFGLLVNYALFSIPSALYLVRLLAYSFVAVYVFNYVKDKTAISHWLLAISTASAALGWAQYLLLPDTRFIFNYGWDDHLYRMIGTFFDPTYLALIILLGIIVAIYTKSNKVFWFLLISLAFTYSRATYLALGLLLLYKKKFVAIVVFAIVVMLLPKMLSEGTDFGRVVSGNNKLNNYIETTQIFLKSPVLGIGFNNLCSAKVKYLNVTNTESHACSGSDSSILFLLATTGIVGLIFFINFVSKMPKSQLLVTSAVVVLIHSIFANSLFYPHIMFWLFALVGLKAEVNNKRS